MSIILLLKKARNMEYSILELKIRLSCKINVHGVIIFLHVDRRQISNIHLGGKNLEKPKFDCRFFNMTKKKISSRILTIGL